MKLLPISAMALSLLFLPSCGGSSESDHEGNDSDTTAQVEERRGADNVAYIWGAAALEGTARDT